MTRSAQAPRTNHNRAPRHSSPEGDVTAPMPRITYDAPRNPRSIDTRGDKKSGLFATPLRAVGTVATAAVVGAGAVLGGNIAYAKLQEHQATSQYDKPGSNGESLSKPDPENASGMQFLNLDPNQSYTYTTEEQIDYIGPLLNADHKEVMSAQVEMVSRAGFKVVDFNALYEQTPVDPSISNTPDQIWQQISSAMAYARVLAREGQLDEALKVAGGIFLDKDELSEFVTSLQNNEVTTDFGSAGDGSTGKSGLYTKPIIYDGGTYLGVTSDRPMMEFGVRTLEHNGTDFDRAVVVFYATGNEEENEARWMLAKRTSA